MVSIKYRSSPAITEYKEHAVNNVTFTTAIGTDNAREILKEFKKCFKNCTGCIDCNISELSGNIPLNLKTLFKTPYLMKGA